MVYTPLLEVSLWGSAVPVSAPWSDEGGVATIFLANGNAVIAIPGIKDGLFGVGGHRSGLMKGRLHVMSFPSRMCVEELEVNRSTWLPILLCTYYHPVAPHDRFTYWDLFDDT